MTPLLLGVVGSTAYGMSTPDSDIDRLGVFAAPTEAFHGLRPPAETIVSTAPDQTLHEVRKFVSLCLKANPTVTELLWLEEYETHHWIGGELIELRSSLLSAPAVRNAYFGYATSQLKRLHETGQFASKMRKRTEKHARHLLRLLDQGLELYRTGRLTIRVRDPEQYFRFGRLVADRPLEAKAALIDAEKAFNEVTSPLPDQPDTERMREWLLDVRAYLFREVWV